MHIFCLRMMHFPDNIQKKQEREKERAQPRRYPAVPFLPKWEILCADPWIRHRRSVCLLRRFRVYARLLRPDR